MAKDKVYITLEAETKKATGAVGGFDKDTEKAFDNMKRNARASTTSMGGSLQKLKQHWVAYSAAAVAAILIARKAIKKMISTIKDLVKASNIQEDAEKALDLALITGGLSKGV